MRVLFEEDVDGSDYLELILTHEEWELLEAGVCKDYPQGLHGERNLNVFIFKESQYAPQKRIIAQGD